MKMWEIVYWKKNRKIPVHLDQNFCGNDIPALVRAWRHADGLGPLIRPRLVVRFCITDEKLCKLSFSLQYCCGVQDLNLMSTKLLSIWGSEKDDITPKIPLSDWVKLVYMNDFSLPILVFGLYCQRSLIISI